MQPLPKGPRCVALLTPVALLASLIPMPGAAVAQPRDQRLRIELDGSSTVAPVAMAAAELFAAEAPDIAVSVGQSGTGGGFKKFLDDRPQLRTDISNASRPIKPAELDRARSLGVEFIELPIAWDGIAVVVHPSNAFCNHLTVAELKRIWSPESRVANWKDIRPGFPDLPLKLYGPGTDSGTFDSFVEAVVGTARACRSDYTASENDNILVQGVAGDHGALGYFGYSYYAANKSKIKLLAVDNGSGKPILPDHESIRLGAYQPLARPLFFYVNRRAADRPEVQKFIEFFFKNASKIVEHRRVNYVALTPELYAAAQKRFTDRKLGTVFDSPNAAHASLESLYGAARAK